MALHSQLIAIVDNRYKLITFSKYKEITMDFELPPWLYLPTDDYDVDLVYAQMEQKLVEGIGFCGWREGAIIDPGKIIGGRPGDADRALRERERKVLKRSLGRGID